VRGRPEQDGAQRVEAQAHQDGELVAAPLEHLGGDGREEEVAASEVHDLEPCRLELGDVQHGLEVLVQHVEEAIGESPEEEQRDDQGERENQGPARQVADGDLARLDWHATRHLEEGSREVWIREGIVANGLG